VSLLGECLFHGFSHLQLPAPEFIRRMGFRQHAARPEELVERGNARG